ncbi:MAG TPA: uroporphyrinogen decarboxylase family protein, partial [Bacillota bacterium]|nr:uroporphyrinogen decarboxylase family protein [Bacillota bacterium]
MNINNWKASIINSVEKKSLPVLSYPGGQLTKASVYELVTDASKQAAAMKAVADRCDSYAALTLMDLSVEAQAFGSDIVFSDNEIPTVTGSIINGREDIEKITVPVIGTGRTGVYIQAVREAKALITDRPVFAGIIGPFSLAGRLMGVTEAMMFCYDDPEAMKLLLEKCIDFITAYADALKKAGADGVIMAEPLTGMLSPDLAEEFSVPFVGRFVKNMQTDEFGVIYHNCGNNVALMTHMIASCGAIGYHFGNAVKLCELFGDMPSNALVMGNIDPAAVFRNGTPEIMRSEVRSIYSE